MILRKVIKTFILNECLNVFFDKILNNFKIFNHLDFDSMICIVKTTCLNKYGISDKIFTYIIKTYKKTLMDVYMKNDITQEKKIETLTETIMILSMNISIPSKWSVE